MSSGGTMNGLSLVYMDGSPALLSFMAARASVGWLWSHATADGGSTQANMMQIDPSNRLELYNPASPSSPPPIILDPGGQSHIEPQGDLDMGVFTTQPTP